MTFSPDGMQIAITFCGKCNVIDLKSGKELSQLVGCDKRWGSDISSDGKILSSFPYDESESHEAYLWNAADGQIIGRVKRPDDIDAKGCSLSFTPDDKKIVAAYSGGLLVWDLPNLQKVRRIKMTTGKIFNVWWSVLLPQNPATHEMTGVNAEGKLLKIDLDEGTITPLLPKQEKPIRNLSWSPDGLRFVTVEKKNSDGMMEIVGSGTINIIDARSGNVLATISEKNVYSASFSPQGDKIVTTKPGPNGWLPWDVCTQVWDANSGKLIRKLPTTANVEFSPDWSYWIDPRPSGIRIARFDNSHMQQFPSFFDGHGSQCMFAKDNRHVTFCNTCGHVVVWRLDDLSASVKGWLRLYPFWIALVAMALLAWSVKKLFQSRLQ